MVLNPLQGSTTPCRFEALSFEAPSVGQRVLPYVRLEEVRWEPI
jgi:hypothetical protein